MSSPDLLSGLLQGNRRALARTITLLESQKKTHQQEARVLLEHILPHTGNAFRIGISGTPGVGKSTFIETFGLHLIGQGLKVAVLAVDPSSAVSGGSILADKTRMERLSSRPEAFIRPSPSAGVLGGVALHTREVMLACEAAGFDVILIETVGVGQSETVVSRLTDVFVLLTLPNAGDDLQAVKRGIMEVVDLILINKADLLPEEANLTQVQLESALRLQQSLAKVLQISALQGTHMEKVWSHLKSWQAQHQAQILHRRQVQQEAWFEDHLKALVWQQFLEQVNPERWASLREQTRTGKMDPVSAAHLLLEDTHGEKHLPENH
ncbi:methylmalonyl Co-A mutase-associated GTPase MeaB [Deinococcus cellulosilyticus]|uniref:ATPase/protein kinase n=1 Tax=Deinococcus cellulosilyticus (strain DSM 18568 / NBRC 106333 / KACC 11606 / 5516J-15) TaxID=1223518 RepID=A0A511N043_DEIC1|nr:methylmalonyl Co-A mutase-associated GTPase MeaB [Deinococcus cellulosilyticus]GEM46203.1 ATPase/protein kinase [Deinococcus cellulosilyticus NBRC 106333 = KACC 11606]